MLKSKEYKFYLDDFMLYCTSKNLSPKTLKSYQQTLNLFFHYLENELGIDTPLEVRSSHLRQYIQYLQERGKYTVKTTNMDKNCPENRTDLGKEISPNTINNYIRNIKVFYNFLVEEEELRKNPIKNIKYLKKRKRKKEALTEKEIDILLKEFDTTKFHEYRDWLITRLLLTTGARVGETLSIKEQDVDFRNKAIILKDTKNKSERYAYLTHTIASDLKRWIKFKDLYLQTDLLFPTNRGTKLTIGSYETKLKKIAKKANIDNVFPHRLRATFAIQFLKNGGSIYVLSKLLGHSSIEVTQVYLDLTDKELQEQFLKYHPLKDLNI
jgi:integrase/recombinase XerD